MIKKQEVKKMKGEEVEYISYDEFLAKLGEQNDKPI